MNTEATNQPPSGSPISYPASATFSGELSGDMECFCWDGVPEQDCEPGGRLYPDDVLRFLGCEQGKRYKFTITVEVERPKDEATPVDRLAIRPLKWTEHRRPCNAVGYDHCIADTAFGRFVLTWKGWKSDPWQDMGVGFDETPWGDVWYDGWDTPEEAKAAAFVELTRRIKSMM